MIEQATLYAIYANNPQALRDYLTRPDSYMNISEQPPLLEIQMPCCNEVKTYEILADVPATNVGPCKCGNWFIYYKDAA